MLLQTENPVNVFLDYFASSLSDKKPAKDLLSTFNITMPDVPNCDVISCIGSGASANVFKARNKDTGEIVAVKVYKMTAKKTEIRISDMCNHPNLLKFTSVTTSDRGETIAIMPFAVYGSLKGSSLPQMTANCAAFFLRDIGSALQYMHSHLMVHLDVKPPNVLMFSDGFKLSDFTESQVLKEHNQKIRLFTGTLQFMAPEIAPQSYYDPKAADMWSLGCTTFYLLFGMYPFKIQAVMDANPHMYNQSLTAKASPEHLEFPSAPVIPSELKEILRGLMDINPETRMKAEELVAHPWIERECG